MTETQIANIVTVVMVFFGMFFSLVAGYVMGYKDAKKHMEKNK